MKRTAYFSHMLLASYAHGSAVIPLTALTTIKKKQKGLFR